MLLGWSHVDNKILKKIAYAYYRRLKLACSSQNKVMLKKAIDVRKRENARTKPLYSPKKMLTLD